MQVRKIDECIRWWIFQHTDPAKIVYKVCDPINSLRFWQNLPDLCTWNVFILLSEVRKQRLKVCFITPFSLSLRKTIIQGGSRIDFRGWCQKKKEGKRRGRGSNYSFYTIRMLHVFKSFRQSADCLALQPTSGV